MIRFKEVERRYLSLFEVCQMTRAFDMGSRYPLHIVSNHTAFIPEVVVMSDFVGFHVVQHLRKGLILI